MSQARKTQPYSALASSGRLRFTVLSGACPEGISFSVASSRARIGRVDAEILLDEDREVSPHHATVVQSDGHVSVADNNSTNGVYLRIRVPHLLSDGDWFRAGGQYFRFHVILQNETWPSPDGTLFFTSPRRKGTFRVVQMLAGGHQGQAATTSSDELTIGGEGSTIAFTSDAHLSHAHCKIYRAPNGSWMIEDLGSTNGTFVRIRGEAPLAHGDQLFVGSELLRVDLA